MVQPPPGVQGIAFDLGPQLLQVVQFENPHLTVAVSAGIELSKRAKNILYFLMNCEKR